LDEEGNPMVVEDKEPEEVFPKHVHVKEVVRE
jgi:hypothetical protein